MRIEKLVFKAGSDDKSDSLVIEPKPITVFIGPNNGGKSASLREIHQSLVTGNDVGFLFKEILHSPPAKININELMQRFTFNNIQSSQGNIVLGHRNNRQEVNNQHILNLLKEGGLRFSPYVYSVLLKHLVLNLGGENRLGLAGVGGSQNLKDPPQSTIAAIFMENELRRKLSNIVRDAFGQYLVIDATSMSTLQYALSDIYPDDALSRSFGDDAINFFSNCTPVSSASDGTKAFIGTITEVIAGMHDILVIDEPEAFLHPALAYLLGREVSRNLSDTKQMFVSTHSAHFLMGCMSVGKPIEIVRLTYKSNMATARLLPAQELQKMMNDPLLRSIGVMGALFFESAIVVEADGDRAFYEEINTRLNLYSENGVRHSSFLNAHNKQGAANIARLLRNVGIPAAMILDLDWIKEDGKVAQRYFAAAGVPEGLRAGLLETRRSVRASLEAKDGNFKTTGGVKKLSGEELATANEFFDQMERYGLFTVRNGELENWLPQLGVSSRKDEWLGKMFERLGANPASSEYVFPEEGDVWMFIKKIGQWIDNAERQGMSYVDPSEL